jgi:hypothetical protein
MTSHLATKQDLLQLGQRLDARFDAVGTRFAAVDARFDGVDSRFVSLQERFDRKLQNLESRVVTKLGSLFVILFGALGTAFVLFR